MNIEHCHPLHTSKNCKHQEPLDDNKGLTQIQQDNRAKNPDKKNTDPKMAETEFSLEKVPKRPKHAQERLHRRVL